MSTQITNQQAFDAALFGIRAQNYERSGWMDEGDFHCMYRDSAGRKCAVGHILPDAIYTPDIENTGVQCLCRGMRTDANLSEDDNRNNPASQRLQRAQHVFDLLEALNPGLLFALQSAHDDDLDPTGFHCGNPGRFEGRMRDIAATYGLTYTPTT
jgi:hypothetical protein